MKFTLPEKVEYIISEMEKAGYKAHIVGGSVRDFLLGNAPDDFDITTNATPSETKAVFNSCRTVDTGIQHGTVSLILDGKAYEITTYRVDGEYIDSRHPDSVSFTANIEEDLARRDFTVNAMAYSPCDGIVDPFCGRADLEKRLIRAVGDPERRFSEDALRILRGIRFAAKLGFEIEEKTAKALREKADSLKKVSAERIYTEFKKTVASPFAYHVIKKYADVLTKIIPDMDKISLPDEELFKKSDYPERLLSIFYLSCDNPDGAFDLACRQLKTDSSIRERGRAALKNVCRYDMRSSISLTHALRQLGEEVTELLVKLEILLGKTDDSSLALLNKLISDNVCYRLSQLSVNGADIASLGFSGREIGLVLDKLLIDVIDGKLENEREKLLASALEMAEQTQK